MRGKNIALKGKEVEDVAEFVYLGASKYFIPYIQVTQPYLLYDIVAWGNAAKIHRTKILTLQKRALRLMHFGDYKSHAIPFFISSRFLPLDMLYFKSVAMHDDARRIKQLDTS